MRISDWSSDVCSSDLRCRSGRGTRSHGPAQGDQEPGRTAGTPQRAGARWRGGVALPALAFGRGAQGPGDRNGGGRPAPRLSTGRRSEEHTSELQSLMRISYAVLCLKKKNKNNKKKTTQTHEDKIK